MATADLEVEPPDAAADERSDNRLLAWVLRLVVAAPDQLAIVLLCAAVVVTALLEFKRFNPFVAILGTAVLVGAAWLIKPVRLPRFESARGERHSALGAIVAIELVGAWIWVNAPYYEQMLSVYRDPSIYALRGWWLTRHPSPLVDVSVALQGAHGVTGAGVAAGGFPVYGTHYDPQGASLVPGLIAVAGRLGGLRALLAANLVIAGVALLLVYALARRMMGPLWALLPMVALALSMPMMYFSRASYTEPTALAAVVGGLLLLLFAYQTRRLVLYLLAGALVGVSALARIDGVLAVVGALLGIGLAIVATRDVEARRHLRRGAIGFAVGGAVASVGGWYDLKHNSPSYYNDQAADLHQLFALFAVVFVLVVVVSYLPLDGLRALLATRRRVVARFGAGLVLVVCAVMASRPLWWVGRFNTSVVGMKAVADRQQAAGLPIDPTRSYDEHSVTWLAWYFTWPVVILAAFGLAVLLYRVVARREFLGLALLATFGLVSALYLNDVSITPDQIWASRRLLPVIMPGVVIAAAFAVKVVAERWRWQWLAGPLAVLVAVGPALQWRYVFDQAEFGGELKAVDAACATIHSAEAKSTGPYVVLAGSPPATGFWGPTLQIVCGADVVPLVHPTPAALEQIRTNWHDQPVTVLTFDAASVGWSAGQPPGPAFSGEVMIWNQSLVSRPAGVSPVGVTFWAGTVAPGGQVAALGS